MMLHGHTSTMRNWKKNEKKTEKRLAELREFKEKHGHTWAMRKKNARFYVKVVCACLYVYICVYIYK